VALTLTRDDAISAYERRIAQSRPWLAHGTGLAA
jgi:hypothetical protein